MQFFRLWPLVNSLKYCVICFINQFFLYLKCNSTTHAYDYGNTNNLYRREEFLKWERLILRKRIKN